MRKAKIELGAISSYVVDKAGRMMKTEWPRGVFRFRRGQYVWVRDKGIGRGGYKIEPARVRERHHHPDRHPFYPNGEGYALDGHLWWDCYPGCGVFATKAEAMAARISKLTN